MSSFAVKMLMAGLALVAVGASAVPVRADEGDPAGWSVAVDPRKRAFLQYVAEAGGPRLLTIGCLRDAEEFFVSSVGVRGLPAKAQGVGLVLSVPDAEFVIYGEIDADTDGGGPRFMAEHDFGPAERKRTAKELLPVLRAPGPIVLQVENGEAVDLPLEAIAPRAGIAAALKTFEKVCFGGK